MVARPGLSLVEVIVSIALLSVVAIAVASSGVVAAQTFARAELHERVVREAEATMDSLLMLRINAGGSKTIHAARITWSAADSAAPIELIIHLPERTIHWSGRR
jgi:prepilin-type N-terminal cleavage/methylation domain-containing protein